MVTDIVTRLFEYYTLLMDDLALLVKSYGSKVKE